MQAPVPQPDSSRSTGPTPAEAPSIGAFSFNVVPPQWALGSPIAMLTQQQSGPFPAPVCGTPAGGTNLGPGASEYRTYPAEEVQVFKELSYCGDDDDPVWAGRVFVHGVYYDVAIKFADMWNQPDKGATLAREASMYEACRSRQGSHIPVLVAYGRRHDAHFLATRFVAGHQLDEQGASTAQAACAEQALRSLHTLGIAHNRVSRDSILLVDGSNEVRIMDLGGAFACSDAAVLEAEISTLRYVLAPDPPPYCKRELGC